MKKVIANFLGAIEFLFIRLPFVYLSFPLILGLLSALLLSHYRRIELILLHTYPSKLVDFIHEVFYSFSKFLVAYIPMLDIDLTPQRSDLLWIGLVFITPIMVRGFLLSAKVDKLIALIWGAIGITYVVRFAIDPGRGWVNNVDYPLYLSGWGAALATWHFAKDPAPDKAEGFHIVYVMGGVMFIYIWLFLTEFLEVL